MGNSESEYEINAGIKQFITEQFARVQKDHSRNYLTITQLLTALHPEDFPIDFSHLSILYICDHDQDGVFSLLDLQSLALWIQVNLPGIQMYQFQAQLQARTVALMIEDLQKKGGEPALILWFMRVLSGGHQKKQIEGRSYILIDAVKTIFHVFNVQMMTGMDIQSFFYLMKKSSEELGFKIIQIVENDEEQQYICMVIFQEFLRNITKGILTTLKDIGYSSQQL